MGVEVRGIDQGDLFAWVDLYTQYAHSRGRDLTDQDALRVWSWITGPEPQEHGFLAVDDGDVVGMLHFHVHPRPLHADHAIHIDDLYTPTDTDNGDIARTLLAALERWAAEHHTDTIPRQAGTPESDKDRPHPAADPA